MLITIAVVGIAIAAMYFSGQLQSLMIMACIILGLVLAIQVVGCGSFAERRQERQEQRRERWEQRFSEDDTAPNDEKRHRRFRFRK